MNISFIIRFIDFVMITYILNFHVCNMNSLFDRKKELYYVIKLLKPCINLRTMCPNSTIEFRCTTSH